MRRTLDGRDKQTCPRRVHARRARLDRHGLEAVDGLAAGMATKTVDRAGKLPRRFLSNQSLGAPIGRGTTSLFNHWLSAVVRPGPATALVCRFTSAFLPDQPKMTNGISAPKSRYSPKRTKDADRTPRVAQLSKSHVERINGGKLDGIATCLCASFGELSYSARPEGRIATTLSLHSAPHSRANCIRLASSSDESWL